MPHHNRIAAQRKAWALTQAELAQLLGMTRANISRIELNAGATTIEKALMAECLFGVSLTSLYPGLYAAAYSSLVPRLAEFSVTLENAEGPEADRKRELLADFARRAPLADPEA